MAAKSSVLRRKFSLLVTGGLLVLQAVAVSTVSAADQFDCKASATGGWDCSSLQKPNANLPPRPMHTAASGSVDTSGHAEDRSAKQLVTQSGGRALKSRSAGYSHLDWIPRDKLTPAQLAEIGPYCGGGYIEPIRLGINDGKPNDESPTYVSAVASRYDQTTQIATLAGNVVLRQGGMQVEGDEANLYQLDNRGELIGNVKLRDKGMLVVGDHAQVQLDSGEAQVDNAEYVLHKAAVRGSALSAKRNKDAIIRLKDGTYTRCEPNSNAWTLKGNNVKLNPATGFGSGTNVTLRVKDVPVFYTPYLYFPIDNRRQSGFLPPSFGSDSDTGFTVVTPYYFNLAPNYDATLYPRYMAKRGLMMEGEFRYLIYNSEGMVTAAYLNDKDDHRRGFPDYSKDRWLYGLKNTTGLSSRWLAKIDYTRISDPYYFQDLSTNLQVGSTTYVNQQGSLTYRGDSFTGRLNAQAYQLATTTDVTPYDRLPQITFDGSLPYEPGGLEFTYGTEFVRFDRHLQDGFYRISASDPEVYSRIDKNLQGLARAIGDRVHLEPGLSLPMTRSWGYLTPTLKYLYTKYKLDLDSKGKEYLLKQDDPFDSSQDRALPLVKVDGGLYFDRDTTFAGTQLRQTLEPRAMYLYVPYKDQDNISVFDTSEPPFSYDSLWRENRFSGKDRIGDAKQLSLGVTTRFIESNGFERTTLSTGQIYYLRNRRVQLPGLTEKDLDILRKDNPDLKKPDSNSWRSPYAVAGLYRFNRDWSVTSDFNWNPNTSRTESGSAMFHYQPEANLNKVFNAGYRYRIDARRFNTAIGRFEYGRKDDIIKQHDFSILWPVVPQWSVIARWQYDYNKDRTLEAFGGFEHDSCCWKLRLINRYWLEVDDDALRNSRSKADRGVFLQIVLKGLGGIMGNKTETFLDKGIQGYRQREDQAM